MPFTVKKGDLVYAADATLGFVEDVFRPQDDQPAPDARGDGDDAGWAAVRVPEINDLVYFTAADVQARDESVPSVLLTITHAQATAADRRREPQPVAKGHARADDVSPLDVGRPETARAQPLDTLGDAPGQSDAPAPPTTPG